MNTFLYFVFGCLLIAIVSAAWADEPKSKNAPITNSIGMKLVIIPMGEFLQGSSNANVAAYMKSDPELTESHFANERPQHKVRITKSFHMSIYETTQGEFLRITGRNLSQNSATDGGEEDFAGMDTSRFPVDNVNWYDGIEFCNLLSEKEGLTPCYKLTNIKRNDYLSIVNTTVTLVPGTNGYRLPTEAEWEYAARAGTNTAFHFGDVLNGDKANVKGSRPFGTTTKGIYLKRSTTVGSYSPNAFGLYDMCGNVYEWCDDWYIAEVYKTRSGITNDPSVNAGSVNLRVLRGGSWIEDPWNSRAASRICNSPGNSGDTMGFRVVRSP